ncbi:hypothetical protein Thi970DRAFT_04299 [Thiorhodovibrio frisius]|uniref:Thioredoxin domain-containing protein n=2 Tax=Thiorhodovibrio frisius TaxID=631362 RepID=H8Z5Z5_9GAMM|nr:hypothetical protein [Thiorhodovibrio frisius]EIC20645.1 hypothetical protein Thi970DRAFT_04299 [Thiorhodovibrio frisius]WPL21393.1 hypothetical protein Thiofri_01518 [Thiorhodovibrio frisius]
MALLAGGLFLIGYQWGNQWQPRHEPASVIEGVRLRPPVPLPDWELHTAAGQVFGSEQLKGFWVLLGVAPIDGLSGHLSMTRMLEVFNRLADRPALREKLRLVLVSPRMDAALAQDFRRLLAQTWVVSGTPEQLARLQAMLTGQPAETETLTSATQVAASASHVQSREPFAAGPDAQASSLHLIDPNAELIAVFPAAQSPAGIARDIRHLAEPGSQEP